MDKEYIRYRSGQPKIPCTFLYPADWKLRETVENGYADIFVAGPRDATGSYSISFTVGVTHQADQTPTEAAMSRLAKFRSAFSVESVGPDSTTVAGRPATAVEVVYSMPLPVNSVDPKWTNIRDRTIYVRQGGRLYELHYSAPEEDYETWLEAFQMLVESFGFSEKPDGDEAAYRSVEGVPQHVQEEASGYKAKKDQNDEKPEQHSS